MLRHRPKEGEPLEGPTLAASNDCRPIDGPTERSMMVREAEHLAAAEFEEEGYENEATCDSSSYRMRGYDDAAVDGKAFEVATEGGEPLAPSSMSKRMKKRIYLGIHLNTLSCLRVVTTGQATVSSRCPHTCRSISNHMSKPHVLIHI